MLQFDNNEIQSDYILLRKMRFKIIICRERMHRNCKYYCVVAYLIDAFSSIGTTNKFER